MWNPVAIQPTAAGRGAAAIRYFQVPSGQIVALEGWDELEQMPGWVRTFNPYVIGGQVAPMENSATRGGWVMAAGDRAETVNAQIEALLSRPVVQVTAP